MNEHVPVEGPASVHPVAPSARGPPLQRHTPYLQLGLHSCSAVDRAPQRGTALIYSPNNRCDRGYHEADACPLDDSRGAKTMSHSCHTCLVMLLVQSSWAW